jgi:hypothetical protein
MRVNAALNSTKNHFLYLGGPSPRRFPFFSIRIGHDYIYHYSTIHYKERSLAYAPHCVRALYDETNQIQTASD